MCCWRLIMRTKLKSYRRLYVVTVVCCRPIAYTIATLTYTSTCHESLKHEVHSHADVWHIERDDTFDDDDILPCCCSAGDGSVDNSDCW